MIGKIKKVKSFTLVEILIASVIFVAVATIASSSLSMIIASSNKTDDLTKSENCARQVSDYVKALAVSDHYGNRMKIVVSPEEGKFVVKDWGETISENYTRAIGLAFFDSPSTFKIVYKQDGDYLIQSGNVYNSNSDYRYSFNTDNSAINSNDCQFFQDAAGGWGQLKDADGQQIYDFSNPFAITREIQIQAAQSPTNLRLEDSGNRIYLVSLKDVVYRAGELGSQIATEDDAKNSGIYSYLDLTFSESDRSI